MKTILLFLLSILSLTSCNNSKWETVKGVGINDAPKSIDQAIYFENKQRGIVAGYKLFRNKNSKDIDKVEFIPILYLTENGGRNWKQIKINPRLRGIINNVYLHGDTLICQIDHSIVLVSDDKGGKFNLIQDEDKIEVYNEKYFDFNRYAIDNDKFNFDNTEYTIKELYSNQLAILIVCYGPETLTDYYFISFDQGGKWKFLQKDYGDNRQRFLLNDELLLCYDYPFGLQKLSLK